MSVHASQKTETNLQVKDTAIQLYLRTAQLVFNKDIVPQPLNSEFRYPVTQNLRDMCTNIAVGLQCDVVRDYHRRSDKLMAAYDCTVIHDTYMELLTKSRDVPDDQMTDILRMNVTVGRLIKTIMADDRNVTDLVLKRDLSKSNKQTDIQTGTDLFSKVNDIKTEHPKKDLFCMSDTSKLSITELRRRAIEDAPEFAGIVNDPTDPISPVIDKVKCCQKKKSEMTSLASSKSKRNSKSSK